MTKGTSETLNALLARRFGDTPARAEHDTDPVLTALAAHGSCRRFHETPVPDALLDMLCAVALSSPSKSDLQQRDIILLRSATQRAKLAALVKGQRWVADAPMIAVICGNNRRQRLLHAWREVAFANDHLDAFFNATGDAAIALGAFVSAAQAAGLGCCPISAVRNEAAAVSELLGLPDHVFPFAGLALGYPDAPPDITQRLPLSVTCHTDRYCEDGLRATIADYDAAREECQPYSTQRNKEVFGQAEHYGWSEDKVRQYSQPERASFGAFVRAKGFSLD